MSRRRENLDGTFQAAAPLTRRPSSSKMEEQPKASYALVAQ